LAVVLAPRSSLPTPRCLVAICGGACSYLPHAAQPCRHLWPSLLKASSSVSEDAVLPAQRCLCPYLATSPLSHARLPPALPLLLCRRSHRHPGPSPTATIVANLTLLLKMDVTTVKSICFVYLFHLFRLFISLVMNFVHFSRNSIMIFACPSL
jgi:hypothetical protein